MSDDDPLVARLRAEMTIGTPSPSARMREALRVTEELRAPLDFVSGDAAVMLRITVPVAGGRAGFALGWHPDDASGLSVQDARQALRDELFERFLDIVLPIPDGR